MGPLGWQETMFIFVLALLIFGPKKLPELGKTIGKAMTEFRRASSELKSTWDREMAAVERESESLKDVTTSYDRQISSSYGDGATNYDSNYDYGYDYGTESQTSSSSSTVGASATEGAEQSAQAAESTVAAADHADTAPATSEAPASGPGSEPVRS